ncbi:alpha/beta hydrolase [Anoxybacterium hadale]|uniref:Alpha/beta hydrolase n=1 Tax=Anoxybacterium hadale TaxID=3408580 RepID=A0ACD1AFX1_9FIRM|nr:alpha/beta hydrolase [Clostridiales bacterium]
MDHVLKIPLGNGSGEVYLKGYPAEGYPIEGYPAEGVSPDKEDQLRPAVIICPGGGYLCIAEQEAEPVARRFAEEGFVPFILYYSIMEQARYRTGQPFKPVLELKEAFRILHQKGKQWGADQKRILLAGSSAGGHLALQYCGEVCCGVPGVAAAEKQSTVAMSEPALLRPAAILLSYPLTDYRYLNQDWSTGEGDLKIDLHRLAKKKIFGTADPDEEQLEALNIIHRLDENLPPTFIWHSRDDGVIDVESSLRLERRLKALGVPCKLHLLEKGIHGEPLENPAWIAIALEWLRGVQRY